MESAADSGDNTVHSPPSKSRSTTLFKTLVLLALLIVIPLFPSQAPDFISHTIFTNFWEVIHILFIGITISYGLFSTKTDQLIPEKIVHSRHDDRRAYLSGISHLSSFFEDGYDNICVADGQGVMHFDARVLGKDGFQIDTGERIRSTVPVDGDKIINEGNVNAKWCSRYLRGESPVVVSNGKYFEPLNLPVRSLRSRVVDMDEPESHNRHEPSPKIDDCRNHEVGILKIRGMVPLNLEKKFEGASALSSSIPWRSRSSGRIRIGEEMNDQNEHSRRWPSSVWEFELEHLKSRPSPSSNSTCSKLNCLNVENVEGKPEGSISPSEVAGLIDDSAKIQSSSAGFPLESENLEYEENNCSSKGDEDKVEDVKQAIESPVIKSSGLTKVLSRAKSVRTIKRNRYVVEKEEEQQFCGQNDGNVERTCGNFEMVEKGSEGESENPPINHGNLEHDNNEANKGISAASDKSSGEEEDEVVASECDTEAELGSEVDRKAGEFIVKFRKQIWLQKIYSPEGGGGW